MSRARSRRTSARGAWDLHYGPNMTPMVDVVMVILVFFMASASVLGPEWFLRSSLPVVRPPSKAPEGPEGPKKEFRFEFTLARSGAVTLVSGEGLEGAPFSALRFRLEQLRRDHATDTLAVVIRPDPGVPYQELVLIHETCQKLRIQKVGMMDREAAPAAGPAPAIEPDATTPAPAPPAAPGAK